MVGRVALNAPLGDEPGGVRAPRPTIAPRGERGLEWIRESAQSPLKLHRCASSAAQKKKRSPFEEARGILKGAFGGISTDELIREMRGC